MNKTFEKTVVTGVSLYSCINGKVNTWEGKETGYILNLGLDKVEAEKVRKVASELIENAKKDTDFTSTNGQKVNPKSWLPTDFLVNKLIKEREGKSYITCKARHEFKRKDGTTSRVYIPIFDKNAQRVEDEENFELAGNAKINVELGFNVVHSPIYQGVSVRIRSIQMVDDNGRFIRGEGSTVGNMFKPVEGTKNEETTKKETEQVPF